MSKRPTLVYRVLNSDSKVIIEQNLRKTVNQFIDSATGDAPAMGYKAKRYDQGKRKNV